MHVFACARTLMFQILSPLSDELIRPSTYPASKRARQSGIHSASHHLAASQLTSSQSARHPPTQAGQPNIHPFSYPSSHPFSQPSKRPPTNPRKPASQQTKTPTQPSHSASQPASQNPFIHSHVYFSRRAKCTSVSLLRKKKKKSG